MDQPPETSETASIHQATFLDGGKFFSSPVRLQDQSAVGRLDYAVDSIVEQLEDGTYRSVGQPEEPRKTYRSCEFCARRKRRCDGDGVNRCSLCTEKNKGECVYPRKLPRKAKPKSAIQQQRRWASGSTTRPPEPFNLSGGGVV
ncbi:unnamed protein product, partial [Ascophyllum nodosum]